MSGAFAVYLYFSLSSSVDVGSYIPDLEIDEFVSYDRLRR